MADASRPTEPVVFGTSIEALVERALRGWMTPEAAAGIQAPGIEIKKLRVAYDFRTWMKLQQPPGGVGGD